MAVFIVAILVWLQLKHFVADYLLQPGWILGGKGDPRKLGGYVHAGIHVLGTAPVYVFAGIDASLALVLMGAEFCIHYVIDYTKIVYSSVRSDAISQRRFWALHGVDQLMHHLTYSAILFVILSSGVRA